jgi:glycolate oxidase iron-sulfur subunit
MSTPAPGPAPGTASTALALRLADQCVMCGLCLPHCPTYRVRREEGESPRGRVAYVKALFQGRLEPSATVLTQLDDCTACGSCEAVCPARVEFRRLLISARADPRFRRADRGPRRWLRWLSRRRRWLRAGGAIARVLRRWRGRRDSTWAELLGIAAALPTSRRRAPPTHGPGPRGTALLFGGCVAALADADTRHAAATVLARLGYGVVAADASHCCGALALHQGLIDEAEADAATARALIAPLRPDLVVGTASGCQQRIADAIATPLGHRAIDMTTWLAAEPRLGGLELRHSPRHVALMLPCTQRLLPEVDAIESLLRRIAGVRVSVLPLQPRCCGAAGSYFADHAEIAGALRAERIEQIRSLAPDEVLTTNVGCRLYLQAGLRRAGLAIPVRHALALVADSLVA